MNRIGGQSAGLRLVSTGIGGIDFLLGGGIPGGAIILIEESKYTNGYADVCARLFLSEGVYRKNRIYFASDGTISCQDFLQTLPQSVVDDAIDDNPMNSTGSRIPDQNMEIAWRYEHLPVKSLQVANERRRQQHSFDLSRPISAEDLRAYKNLITYDAIHEASTVEKSHYTNALAQLKRSLFDARSIDDQDEARWHRIFVRNLGSPFWMNNTDKNAADVIEFMAMIRALIRQKSTAVALVTMSTAFIEDDGPLLRKIRQLADVVFRLDPIDVGEKEKSILDYHGFFRCLRTPSINSIAYPTPDCADYAFKLKKKEFLIERLHLPPDLSETASRSQLDQTSCASSSSKSKLDF